jgi:glycosyltransferase involved in cell wall biosynthesis
LIPAERIVVIHNGTHPACSPDPDPASDAEAARLLGTQTEGGIEILHVGSTIPRKRIDALLQIFASILRVLPDARLIRVGGPFTDDQAELVERLNLSQSILTLPFLDRGVLAAVYRRAALVLQPSESEGFGLPVIEAMACGTPVIASDLAVMREVGGDAVRYCPVNDLSAWHDTVIELLDERTHQPDRWSVRRQAALTQAARFSWAGHARKLVEIYKELLRVSQNNCEG